MSEVYFAESGGHIKIGFSRDVKSRMQSLASGNPSAISIIATMPGGRDLEGRIHADLAAHRYKNEWFNDCEEVRAAIGKYSVIAETEAARVRDQEKRLAEIVSRAPEPPANPGLNFTAVGARFSKLIELDTLDRLSEARRAEKDLGLVKGALMDQIMVSSKRKQFGEAVDLLLYSHKQFGKLLDKAALSLVDADDMAPYFVASERLISVVETAFAPFLSDIKNQTGES